MSEEGVRNSYRRLEWNYCPVCSNALREADDGQSPRPHCTECNRFFYTNPTPAACCFLTNPEGQLLLVQRSIEPRRGLWTLPGGFVEVGETTEEGALRELREETGLIATSARLLGITTRSHKATAGIIVIGYLVDEWEGEMAPDSDAMDAGFYHRADRPEIAFEVHMDLIDIYDNLDRTRLPGM